MTWEYLRTPELAGRLLLIAGWLGTRVAGATILDLNCGWAPLLPLLPDTWQRYVGNDICQQFIAEARRQSVRAELYVCADDDLPTLDRLDILVCLGYACGVSAAESESLERSIKRLVARYRPSAVVLEAWAQVAASSRLLDLVQTLQLGGYVVAGAWSLLTWPAVTTPQSLRVIFFLEVNS